LVTFVWPFSAAIIGVIGGVWIVLSRTIFVSLERHYSGQGAVIQEQFDMTIFGMLPTPSRVPEATPELISRTLSDDRAARAAIKEQSLEGWYPFDLELDGTPAIAIAQRANAAYSERLLTLNARVWLTLTCTWSAVTIGLSVGLGLPLGTFLLGVALPLLPALLDVIDQWHQTRQASKERLNLANAIQDAINESAEDPIKPEELLVWQDQLFGLRRDAPQVPNFLYRQTRNRNELAMNAAARDLSSVARKMASGGTTYSEDRA
jgi:hypothetical protein